jgi:Glycosyl hydrolase catalytic core
MRTSVRWGAVAALAGLAACGTKGSEPATPSPGDASLATGPSGPTGDDAQAPGDDGDGSSPTGTATPSGDDSGADAALPGSPGDAALSDSGAASPGWKRGLAYGYDSDSDMTALSKGIGWWYNWAASPDGTLSKGFTAGVEFVPMIWGGTFDTTTLAKQVPAGAKYLLTFNEPNFGSQSNLTPDQAAALWPQIQSFANARGMKIVSPAVNYCGSPCNDTDPFDWLTKFFAACTNCQVDYVAMHWYACTKSALTSTVAKYEQMFGKPLWVTEFSCLDTSSDVTDAFELSYMKDAVAALEADPMVFRYSWFTGRSSGSPPISVLGSDGGVLTPLGQQYVTLPR